MRNKSQRRKSSSARPGSRGLFFEWRQAERRVVRGRATEETRVFVPDCISHGSDSLDQEFPAHFISRFEASCV
jgi:hypothetical protein